MPKKIETSPIAKMLLTSLQLARITEYLVSQDCRHIMPPAEYGRAKSNLTTLTYLAEHYCESEKNYSSPILQMSAAHRLLVEECLSHLFPEANARSLNQIGDNYIFLTRFIKGVQHLTDQANQPQEAAEKASEPAEPAKQKSPPKKP